MKFLQNAIDRIFNHWQSTLFGLGYAVLTYMLWHKDITMAEWAAGMGTLLTVKGVFINKDPDKTANKPSSNPNG